MLYEVLLFSNKRVLEYLISSIPYVNKEILKQTVFEKCCKYSNINYLRLKNR